MSDREIGELAANQHAMKDQIGELKEIVEEMRKQQELIFRKFSSGRGFVVGLMFASGGIGAAVASVFNKIAN